MKIIISPAKSLEEEKQLATSKASQHEFFDEAIKLNRKLARMSKPKLSKVMKISDNLADLNYGRFQEFDESNKTDKARPAVYLYDGDVYNGLDVYSLPNKKIDQLQSTLRIISGMYGVLKPLDVIQPYRLEMSTKLQAQGNDNLYEFWKEKITESFNNELKEDELFLNLASKEYSKAIDEKALKTEMISQVFKDFKNGKLRVVAIYAKKARGAMVRYVLDKNASSMEEVLGFDYMGYGYSEKYTENENEPVFVR